jgi:peptidoglycan/xylan/chitin deacetylase (PgdA/CDA1 family)
VIIGALAFFQPHWAVNTLAQASPRVLYFYETEEPVIALTIDDGPARGTESILSVLAAHNSKATFFIITEKIPGYEETLTKMVAAGHEIGNHMTREQASILLNRREFEHELASAQQALKPFGSVRWFRPGSGWYSAAMLDEVEARGLHIALGSVYPFDNYLRSPKLIADHVLSHVRPGAVVVLHDAEGRGYATAQALNIILPELENLQYKVTTLSELEAVVAAELP